MFLHRTYGRAAVLALALSFSPTIFATGDLPWGKNFEKPELLVGTLWCDARQTAFATYQGSRSSKVRREMEFTGLTISISGKTKFHIYSPNPDSMSPITFSFFKDDNGSYKEISRGERDQRLSKEAPNLHAMFYGKKNDCVNVPATKK